MRGGVSGLAAGLDVVVESTGQTAFGGDRGRGGPGAADHGGEDLEIGQDGEGTFAVRVPADAFRPSEVMISLGGNEG
jgi:hypothetical protein